MNIWIRQNASAMHSAGKQIISAPGNFIFNVLVVAVALSLPIAGLTLIENIRPVSDQLSIAPELSVFLTTDSSRANALALADPIKKLLKNNDTPAKLQFVTREAALSTLENSSGLNDVLATLGENPLPDSYVLTFEQHFELGSAQFGAKPEASSTPARIETLASQLEKLPDVDHVQIDSNWIRRLAALLSLAQFSVVALALILAIVVTTVIFNATRLQVLSHRAEIRVMRLLGATNQYIRRPYYYTGVALGLSAGLAALILVAVGLHPMNQAILEFASLYGSSFQLAPLNLMFSSYLLVLAGILGLFGAFLSVRHQIRQLN